MSTVTQLQQQLQTQFEQLRRWLDAKSPRERYLVIFCAVFVLLSIIGLSVWKAHDLANEQQKRLNQLKDLTIWMQSNAVTMQPNDASSLTVQDKIQRAAQQQGLSVATQGSAEQVQLIVQHANYAVLANFLTQLAQMGLSIEKMEIVSSNNELKLTANVR